MLDALVPGSRISYRQGLANLQKSLKLRGATHLVFASLCSGTDVYRHAVNALVGQWRLHFGLTVPAKFVFAGESHARKQEFIAAHWPGEVIFADVTKMGDTHSADAHGMLLLVPSCHILLAGFECSTYNYDDAWLIVMRRTTHESFDVGIASYGAFSKHMKLLLGLTSISSSVRRGSLREE
jgi:hypothetical protein